MWFVVACVAFCLMWAAPAAARTRVTWSKVEVRKGDDQKRVAESMTRLLVKASRKAKWGKGEPLELKANVTKLSWETRDDVVLVSVTVVAKISGGKTARSHIRIGGRPSDKRKLETQALGIVADGLVTRLSDIARRDGG
jgi:hypothetical protein